MRYRFKDKHELQTVARIYGGIFLVLANRPHPRYNGVTDDLCDNLKMLIPCVHSKAYTVFPQFGSQVLKLISVLERSDVFCNCVTNITFILTTHHHHINVLLYFLQ